MPVEIGFGRDFKMTDNGWVLKTEEDKQHDEEITQQRVQQTHQVIGDVVTNPAVQSIAGAVAGGITLAYPPVGLAAEATLFAVSGGYGVSRQIQYGTTNREVTEEDIARRVEQIKENAAKEPITLQDAQSAVFEAQNNCLTDAASNLYKMPVVRQVVGPAPEGTNLEEGFTYLFDDADLDAPIMFTVDSEKLVVDGVEKPCAPENNPVIVAYEHDELKGLQASGKSTSFLDSLKYDLANPVETLGRSADLAADLATNPFIGIAATLGLGAASVAAAPAAIGMSAVAMAAYQWNNYRAHDKLENMASDEIYNERVAQGPSFEQITAEEAEYEVYQKKEHDRWKMIKDAAQEMPSLSGPKLAASH